MVGGGSSHKGRGPKGPEAASTNGFEQRVLTDSSLVCFSGNMALPSSAPGGATAHGLGVVTQAQALPREQGQGSLQEAGRRLALHRALLLWRTQLSQRQRAEQVSVSL